MILVPKSFTATLVAVTVATVVIGPACGQDRLRTIESAMAVRELPAREAQKGYPVRIQAVVTYVNAQSGELFVQDSSAGIFVFIRHSKSNVPLQAGQRVRIAGVTAPGDFSSSITNADIEVTGRGAMPKPVRLPFEHLLTGREDCQWGELTGVVRSGRINQGALNLNASTAGGTFLVIMKDYPPDWAARLIDAKVTLAGVLAAVFNERRQVAGVRLFIPDQRLIHLDDAAPALPFEMAISPAGSVGAFQQKEHWGRRVRVRATVTAAASSTMLYVSDGDANLPVVLDSPYSAQPGELMDLVGFPGTVEGRPGLRNSICRRVAGGRGLQAHTIAVRDLLPVEAPDAGSGLSIAAGTRHDLDLVAVEGTLIQTARGLHSETLTLASLDRNFAVTVPESVALAPGTLQLGSKLNITGVCVISSDEYRHAQSFRILVRRATDLVVESRPPWWNASHALWVIGAMLLSVFAALGWISVLRKHVAAKTNELREVNGRLARAAAEDALTGIANRRRFDEMLGGALADSREHAVPLTLIIADLDHFKAVNDLHGHQTGDRCLVEMARALQGAVPKEKGVLARYGGEEFALILPEIGEEQGAALAEKMRRAVEQTVISHAPMLKQALTVSLGVGTCTPGSEYSADRLIGLADRALYCAKQKGRNCVVTAAPEYEDLMMTGMLNRLGERVSTEAGLGMKSFQSAPKTFQ